MKMKKKIRVLIADDHAIVRAGVATVVGLADGIEIVGEAADGRAAVEKAKRLRPDVVLMDLMMPVLDGVAATAAVVANCPAVRVLILTTDASSRDIVRALDAGAIGVVIKTAPNSSIVSAIRAVADGQRTVPPEVEQLLRESDAATELTDRQKAVLTSITRGIPNKQIADQLGISLDGVKGHVRRICTKIGASTRAEAVAIALRKHLLKL